MRARWRAFFGISQRTRASSTSGGRACRTFCMMDDVTSDYLGIYTE